MFQRIEAHGYRCLRSVKQSLNAFEILVGSNASGKSTFLDVIAFLGNLVSEGLEAAVERRTTNFHDLTWGRNADHFELAVEALIPEDRRVGLPVNGRKEPADTIRYDVRVHLDTLTEKLHIAEEQVTIFSSKAGLDLSGIEVITRSGAFHFISEVKLHRYEREQPHRNYSGLNSIPVDAEFPAAAWLREQLRGGIKPVMLDPAELRKPSPPATSDLSDASGSYLARSIAQVRSRSVNQFEGWLAHVRTVLPDIKDIRTIVKDDDRHRYVVIDYENGISVPSWMVSDGTLRLLALTLLAYAPDSGGVYLIEEPEKGVHPTALQAIYESLSSVYEGQVLIASHSPVLLSMAKPEQLLCFAKTPDGTEIVRGSEHRALRDWQGEVSLGMLAASGILG
jgi:predicted ATPase